MECPLNQIEEYANFAVATHSPAEFVIDFFRLLPDTRENEAKEWVELSGGIDAIIDKALDNLKNKKYKLAAHLIEVAYYADKKNEKLHEARKEIYAALSKKQDSSMARNIFNHANLASNELKRDLASED